MTRKRRKRAARIETNQNCSGRAGGRKGGPLISSSTARGCCWSRKRVESIGVLMEKVSKGTGEACNMRDQLRGESCTKRAETSEPDAHLLGKAGRVGQRSGERSRRKRHNSGWGSTGGRTNGAHDSLKSESSPRIQIPLSQEARERKSGNHHNGGCREWDDSAFSRKTQSRNRQCSAEKTEEAINEVQ